jgi:hypothetical protein
MDNGYKITEIGDVIDKLFTYRDTYNEKGKYLGFKTLHEYYSMSLGNCTDWTGYPMSGKTQVLMELLINTSMFYGWKHLIYFPDVGTNVEIIADLIHKKTGKSFNPSSNNVITNEEINRNIDWVIQHFKVLTKSDVKAKMTPIQFWDMAVQIQKHEGLHTASIDSWKDLTHNYSDFGGYAQYLEYVLPYRNQIAEDNNLHLHTIIHPKLTEKVNGKRAVPVPYDLKGGSEWFNSGKCMITVHRQDTTHNLAEIHFNKIKPRSNGKVGSIEIWFDKDRLTYFEQNNPAPNVYEKIYASPQNEVIKETNIHTAIQQNVNFDDGLPF